MGQETDDVIGEFLRQIAPIRNHITAMYLFGSRSRQDWRPDSDYDILIVVDRRTPWVNDRLYDAVMDLLLSTGKLISLKIFNAGEFERLRAIPTPFMQNAVEGGIHLGFDD